MMSASNRKAAPVQPPTELRQVTATGQGPWPGQDPVEANRIICGELGGPHLPFIPELPGRGVGSDAVGRTAALLVELAVDVQPHGWRIVDRPGQDMRRAVSALSTDINVLADVTGEEDVQAQTFKVQLVGPLSLAAGLHLHNGERALLDYGARRDIAASLAAGVEGHLRKIAAAVPSARLVVQLDEPDIAAVLAGTIPTASGYQTLRSLGRQEVTESLRLVVKALHDAGAAEVVVAIPEVEAPIDIVLSAGADGLAVGLKALTSRQWEQLAAAVESGKRLWAGAAEVNGNGIPATEDIVAGVWRPWRQLGLTPESIAAVRLTPSTGLAGLSPREATTVLRRLTQAADELNQLALG